MPKLQEQPTWCGPAALQAVLEQFHYYRTQAFLAQMCRTTRNGTGDAGMLTGIRRCGFTPLSYSERSPDQAKLSLSLMPGLLCVDSWSHWIAVLGRTRSSWLCFDPGNWRESGKRNGIVYLTWPKLRTRWACGPATNGTNNTLYDAIYIAR